MTAADPDALIGPVTDGRERVVMHRRGREPARVHPDYRALLNSPLPELRTSPAVSTTVAIVAAAIGLIAAALIVAAITVAL